MKLAKIILILIIALLNYGCATESEEVVKRLEVLETVAGQRQSGLEEGGAHPVKKNADGSFSWEGSGLLL